MASLSRPTCLNRLSQKSMYERKLSNNDAVSKPPPVQITRGWCQRLVLETLMQVWIAQQCSSNTRIHKLNLEANLNAARSIFTRSHASPDPQHPPLTPSSESNSEAATTVPKHPRARIRTRFRTFKYTKPRVLARTVFAPFAPNQAQTDTPFV